jgi:ribonuclease HII
MINIQRLLSPVTRLSIFSILMTIALTGGPMAVALAQTPAQQKPEPQPSKALTPEQKQKVEEFHQTRAELQQIEKKLGVIQKQTLEARPELQQQQSEFASLVEGKMKSEEYNPKQELAELEKLQGQLEGEKISEEQRQELMGELQQKWTGLQEAQQEALQDPEVKQAHEQLAQDITAAMKKENPETEQLIQQMEQKQQKLQEIYQSVNEKQ